MTSLEFINKLIKDTEQSIKFWKEKLEIYPNDEAFTRCLNTRIKELQKFYQIKSILEAWEWVAIHTLITDGGVLHMTYEDDDVGYETVINALEVKE